MRNGEILHLYKGKVVYADDTTYEGELKMGKPHGFGLLKQQRAGKVLFTYEGYWADGKKHGRGKMADNTSGVWYDGEWEEDTKHGVGRQFVPEKLWPQYGYNEYDGDWVRNKRDGFGRLRLPNQTVYEGPFKSNVREGKGQIILDPDEKQKEITVEYDDVEEAEKV